MACPGALWTICKPLSSTGRAAAVQLPAKTSAFKDWAARLQAYAGTNRYVKN